MSAHPSAAHLRAEELSLSYGGRPALQGVSLAFPRGSVTSLVGPSGCGKTSFLCALNRLTDLIPGCEVRGRVLLDGADLREARGRHAVAEVRKRVGMIFQKPNPFPLSIRRNLELPLREHGVRRAGELAARVEESLRDAALWDEVKDRLDSPAQALSGGQQQRLCIARALTLRPEVLLMDEPCSSLDPVSSARVEALMAALRARTTLVIVTHSLGQARRVSDFTAVFWRREGGGAAEAGAAGEVIESGPTSAVFARPAHELTASYLSGAFH